MSAVLVADVALDPRAVGADALYTYLADENISVGDAVMVPIGTRSAFGFVVQKRHVTAQDLGFSLDKLKPPNGVISGLSLPDKVVEIARFVADETLSNLPTALGPAIPPGARDRMVTKWTLTGLAIELTAAQQEVVRAMRDLGGSITETKAKPLPAPSVRVLRALRQKGVVTRSLEISLGTERRRTETLRLTSDGARIEAFLATEGKRKPSQALTVMRLQSSDVVQLTSSEIKALAGVTDATVRALLDSGILEPVDAESSPLATPPTPNPWQQLAIDSVVDAIRGHRSQGFLLFGVTGSGKTEVFLRAATEALRQGRSVLYLVPEIALATQSISQLRARFGSVVTVLHSELTATERLRNWLRVRNGEASVILGARSAVFAPLENVGLIIIDEEHEASYKQESAPRYHARTVARKLASLHRCPIILGSATPSIESFYEAEVSETGPNSMTLLSLPVRAAEAQLPVVTVEDLKAGYRVGNPTLLTPDLELRVRDTVARGEQVILFLNRRAYSPFLICRDCGHRMECPNCAVSLSFHRKEQRLRCHHCGYTRRPPTACPQCGRTRISPFGAGTEKVEEIVGELFPTATVARLDRDIARKKGALEDILARFRTGEIDILVGTQMVAKGLDFPNVTLVGVIAADVSLNIPDFRSSERTFQLLSQVAGRAGRGSSPGSVVVQTFNPDHPSVESSRRHEYLPFYEALKEERREAGYPPFTRLVNITFTGTVLPNVRQASEAGATTLRNVPGLEVLGPVDCALERVQGRWRRHILIKLAPSGKLVAVGNRLATFAVPGVQVTVDVDPYSLM